MIPCCDFEGCPREGDVGLAELRTKQMRWVCQVHYEALCHVSTQNGCTIAEQARASGALARSRQHLAPQLMARRAS